MYRALCVTNQPVTVELLNKLNNCQEFTIDQITPIRVLHRRPWRKRQRKIYEIKATINEGETDNWHWAWIDLFIWRRKSALQRVVVVHSGHKLETSLHIAINWLQKIRDFRYFVRFLHKPKICFGICARFPKLFIFFTDQHQNKIKFRKSLSKKRRQWTQWSFKWRTKFLLFLTSKEKKSLRIGSKMRNPWQVQNTKWETLTDSVWRL